MSPVLGFPGYEKNDQERKNVYDCPRGGECELYINQNSRCEIVLEDGGAPKATPILRKRIYPSFHGALVQSLNESRSMSGSCGTRCGPKSACGRKRTEKLTWAYRSPYGQSDSDGELHNDQTEECATKPLVPLCHSMYPTVETGTPIQHAIASIQREELDLSPIVIWARIVTQLE